MHFILWDAVTANFTCVHDGVTGYPRLVKHDSGHFRAGVLGEVDGHIREPRKQGSHPRVGGPRPISQRSQQPRKADPLPSKGAPCIPPWASSASDSDTQWLFLHPQLADPPAHAGPHQLPQSHEPSLATRLYMSRTCIAHLIGSGAPAWYRCLRCSRPLWF